MKAYFTKRNIVQTILPLILFFGFAVYGFGYAEPTQDPTVLNVAAPVNTSVIEQKKTGNFWANNIIAERLLALSELCVGGDCRNEWPADGTDFSTSCKVNHKLIYDYRGSFGLPHGPTGSVENYELARLCESRIAPLDLKAGWMFISFDNCPGVQSRDCAGASYCHFIQLQCDAGVKMEQGRFFR